MVGVKTEPEGEFQFSIWLSNWVRPSPCVKAWRSERIDGTCSSSHWRGESGERLVCCEGEDNSLYLSVLSLLPAGGGLASL